jgi:hypothetical protein
MTRRLRSVGLAAAVLVGTASSSGTVLAATVSAGNAMAGTAAQDAGHHHDQQRGAERHGLRNGERTGGDHPRQDGNNMKSAGSGDPPPNCTGGVSSSSDGNAGGTGGSA